MSTNNCNLLDSSELSETGGCLSANFPFFPLFIFHLGHRICLAPHPLNRLRRATSFLFSFSVSQSHKISNKSHKSHLKIRPWLSSDASTLGFLPSSGILCVSIVQKYAKCGQNIYWKIIKWIFDWERRAATASSFSLGLAGRKRLKREFRFHLNNFDIKTHKSIYIFCQHAAEKKCVGGAIQYTFYHWCWWIRWT